MNFRLQQRVFFKKNGEVKSTLSLPKDMAAALDALAVRYGYSRPELISIVLDQFLVQEALDGRVAWPEGFDPKSLEG